MVFALVVKKQRVRLTKSPFAKGTDPFVYEQPFEGFYLFGFIPLYLRELGPRKRRPGY